MTEIAAKECIFHFNKAHLTDPTIPMWVIKAKGKTFYVESVTSNIGWTTKQTPDNNHTKGAIKFKNVIITFDDDNNATINDLTSKDAARIRAKEKGYTRILISSRDMVSTFIKNCGVKFTTFKRIAGSCGSSFFICDIKEKNDITMMQLGLPLNSFRILQENEAYFKAYDDDELLNKMQDDDYDYADDDED